MPLSPSSLLDQTTAFVRDKMRGDSSGHDFAHVERVVRLALKLCETEKADRLIVHLAALLHDIADYKFHDGDTEIGPRVASAWLTAQGLDAPRVEAVASIVATLSFKGAGTPTPMATLEGQIVQDADRLDALGAIGIARTFAYGGASGRPMYDPALPPTSHATFDAYQKNQGSTLNHFYEKLLLLKDRMNTPSARALAEGRHAFMKSYLEQFYKEWDGLV